MPSDAKTAEEFLFCFALALAKSGHVVLAKRGTVVSWSSPVHAVAVDGGVCVTADCAALPGAPQVIYRLEDGWRVIDAE